MSFNVFFADIYFYTEGDYNYTILTDLIPPTEVVVYRYRNNFPPSQPIF
jgi:hypothetical protein